MPLPTLADLQGAYGMGNPQAYLQAQDNMGLETQFRQQQFLQEQEKTKKESLANIWAQEDRPRDVERQGLANRNLDWTGQATNIANQRSGLTLEREKALQQMNLDADQRKALLSISDDHLKEADQAVEMMRRSLDPSVQAQGEKLYQLTGAARALKQKHLDDMEKEKYKEGEATKRTKITSGATIEAAKIGAQSRLDVAAMKANAVKGIGQIEDLVKNGKLTYEKAATALAGAAMFEPDPELKAQYEAAAAKFEQANLNARNAGAQGKPDTGAITGLPTQNIGPVLGNNPDVPKTEPVRKAPAVGMIKDGYVFLGGNPADPKSWKKQ